MYIFPLSIILQQFIAVKETLARINKHEGVIGYMLFKISCGIPVKVEVETKQLKWGFNQIQINKHDH